MPSTEKDHEIAHMSQVMFGNHSRLKVAAAIADAVDLKMLVSARDLEEATGLRYGPVRTDVNRLKEGGLLTHAGEGDGGRQMFKPVDTPYWYLCRDVLRAL